MRTFGIIAASLVVLIVGAVVAYYLAYPSYTHRYRLTLEVETPQGIKTGSGVIEARISTGNVILSGGGARTSLEGQAVFVDLGGGKNLIALLAGGPKATHYETPVFLAINAFDLKRCPKRLCEWEEVSRVKGSRDVNRSQMLTLATAPDVNDAKSVVIVDPEDFEKVLGPGYKFKRARVEITEDPVTQGLERKLPFLVTQRGDLTGSHIIMRAEAPYIPSSGQFSVEGY
jgi:hypothetical protein